MPTRCMVFGCSNEAKKGSPIKLYRIPSIRQHESAHVQELTERRRLLWLKAVNRKDITAKTVKAHHFVCSEHFVSGRPSYYLMETDPDWIPNKNLGYGAEKNTISTTHARIHSRNRRKKDVEAASTLVHMTACAPTNPEPEQLDMDMDVIIQHEEIATEDGRSKSCSTEMTMEDIERYRTCVNEMTVEVVDLKEKLQKKTFDEHMFKGNNENVKYYTGLVPWQTLFHLISTLNIVLPRKSSRHSLTNFQRVLVVLIKLRHGLTNKFIGDIFDIDSSTVSRIFLQTLDVMYENLKFLIHWPDHNCLKETMPLEFVKHFGRRVAVIIDCFETFIEKPSNSLAKAETYSQYKSHNTIKYLIGITPQGSISFISDGWGGRTSDKHIVEHSDFLSKLEMGDIVLADRGFDIHDSVSLMCAEIKIPAFTKGKKQLSPFEVEQTRKLAHLRIHVERVIGNMSQKYTILNNEMPIDYLLTNSADKLTTLDKMVTVCACLVNLCPSVVPFS